MSNQSLLSEYSSWAQENPGAAFATATGVALGAFALYKADEKFLKGTITNATNTTVKGAFTQLQKLANCRKKGEPVPNSDDVKDDSQGEKKEETPDFKRAKAE